MSLEGKEPSDNKGVDDSGLESSANELARDEENLAGFDETVDNPPTVTSEDAHVHEVGVPPVSSSSSLLLKKLFGSKKKILVWCAGLAVVVIASFGAVSLKSYLDTQAELHETASSNFELARADFNSNFTEMKTVIGAAQLLLKDTDESMVADPLVLANLEELIGSVDSGQFKPVIAIKFDEHTTEEIQDVSHGLRSDTSSVRDQTLSIKMATIEVEDSKALKTEEVAAAAKQAKIDAAGTISYEQLARGGDSLLGNYYWFEGEVIQDAGAGTYRISITKDPGYSRVFWKDPILVTVVGATSQKLLENDVVSFVGASLGAQSYESIFGQEISLPMVTVEGAHVTVTGRTG